MSGPQSPNLPFFHVCITLPIGQVLYGCQMARLFTPLVLLTVVCVSLLGISRMILIPESLWASLAAVVFLPLVIGALLLKSGKSGIPNRDIKISGKLRAALVGAGVALGTGLLLSVIEHLGLTEIEKEGSGRFLVALVPAFIAVMADIVSARLEDKALGKSE